jgi:hypothetical protein
VHGKYGAAFAFFSRALPPSPPRDCKAEFASRHCECTDL